MTIVAVKGWVAGTFSVAFARLAGFDLPGINIAVGAPQ